MTALDFDPDTRHYHWKPVAATQPRIPQAYRYWIHLPGSLTQALRQRSPAFRVEVLDERHLLINPPIAGLDSGTGARRYWSRKVRLCDGDRPWVMAHTLVPEHSLRNGLGQLTRLGGRPLGELLFTTPGVTKDNLQVAETPVGWGRRARYRFQGQPLMVTEFFLEDLIRYEHQRLAALSETDPS